MLNKAMHYGLTREEFASRAGKDPSCFENRLRPLCGNGSFHASMTRRETHVNCEACKLLPPMADFIAKKKRTRKGKMLKPFAHGDWHAWQGAAAVLLSDEAAKKLYEFKRVDDCINWLWVQGAREAARALNKHAKGE